MGVSSQVNAQPMPHAHTTITTANTTRRTTQLVSCSVTNTPLINHDSATKIRKSQQPVEPPRDAQTSRNVPPLQPDNGS